MVIPLLALRSVFRATRLFDAPNSSTPKSESLIKLFSMTLRSAPPVVVPPAGRSSLSPMRRIPRPPSSTFPATRVSLVPVNPTKPPALPRVAVPRTSTFRVTRQRSLPMSQTVALPEKVLSSTLESSHRSSKICAPP